MFEGNQVLLRPLCLEDVTDTYINWMNDYDVVKYTESRFKLHVKESLKNFVENCNSSCNYTFAIIYKETSAHIGNIKLGNINWYHRCGDIGLIIGKPEFYGRGIATEAISLACEYGFRNLGLHRITSGAYASNIGSIRAFEKNGFQQYGKPSQAYYFEGKYIDAVLLEKLNPYEVT